MSWNEFFEEPEDVRSMSKVALRRAGIELSDVEALISLPRSEWPPTFRIHWDLRPECFYLTTDDHDKDSFGAVLLGKAALSEVISNIQPGVFQCGELWARNPLKIANAIYRFSNGLPVSPPMLIVANDIVIVAHGNNRFRICLEEQVDQLYFLASSIDRFEFERRFESLVWLSESVVD